MPSALGIALGVPPLGGDVPSLDFTVTTTSSPETVTLQQITPSGADVTVDWGDGNSTVIADGNTGTTTHDYATAGTYEISISNAPIITSVDLRGTGFVIDTANFRGLPRNLDILTLYNMNVGSVFDSSDFAGSTPSTSLLLYFSQAGTYTFDSSDFAGSTPSTNLRLRFLQAGTYTFDSADFAGSTPSTNLLLRFLQAGTYTFDSADFAGSTPSTYLWMEFDDTTLTTTTTQAFWGSGVVRAVASPTVKLGLTQAQVDDVLLGIYDDFANRTASNGTLDVSGNNASPSGTLQAQCPPTTGKEAAHELVNDSCAVSGNHYAAVTIN